MTHEIRSERITTSGLTFHVNTCGEGDRLALCLHGFPEIGASWRHQLPLLASLGYRAWAPDLRGYGGSDRPEGLEAYAIEHLVDDVGTLIDAAGTRETVLLAHDWGAMIAWQVACHRTRPLERLVILNGPAPGIGVRRTPSVFSRAFWRSFYVLVLQLPWLPERMIGRGRQRAIEQAVRGRMTSRPERCPDEVVQIYKDAAALPGAATAMVNYYRALVRGGGFRRLAARGFPVIETPTLLVWGEDDPVLVPSTLDDADDYLKHLTRRFVPRAGHWVQQEAPEEVNEILGAWLRDEPVPGSERPTSASREEPA